MCEQEIRYRKQTNVPQELPSSVELDHELNLCKYIKDIIFSVTFSAVTTQPSTIKCVTNSSCI